MPNLEITPNAQQQDSATSHYLDEAGVGVLGDDDEQARALGDVVRVGGGLQVAARPVAGRAPAARLKAHLAMLHGFREDTAEVRMRHKQPPHG